MEQTIERCCVCDDATGRAGRSEDSLYTSESDKGPFCESCYRGAQYIDDYLRAVLYRAEEAEAALEKKDRRIETLTQWNNNAARLRDVAEAALCRVRGELQAIHIDASPGIDNEGLWEKLDRIKLRSEKALSSTPCLHEAEAKRLREAVEVLCREALGAIIDATTLVQVENLSGNIVKEAYAKGELHSLRLLESWLDRHVPKTMAELRRRAKE